jgi:tetratricopeptide (TPR) repeat protein
MNISKGNLVKVLGACLLVVLVGTGSFAQKKGKTVKKDSFSDPLVAEMYFIDAEKYYMLEDFAKSYALYQKSLEFDEENGAAHYKLADINLQQDDLPKALYHSKKAIEINPKNKYYHLQLAEIHTKQSDFNLATEVFENLIKTIPGNENFYFDLAAIYLYQGDLDKAVQTYTKAENHYGIQEEITAQKQKIYLRQNKLKEALEEGEKLISAFPDQENYIMFQADILYNNNREKEAIVYLEKALKINPNNPRARIMLADIYKEAGNKEKYKENISVLMNNPDIDFKNKLQILVMSFQNLKDENAQMYAKSMAESVVQAHPEEADAYVAYGDLLNSLGEKVEASLQYEKAIRLDQSNFAVWHNLVSIELLDLGNAKKALKFSDQALELFPNQGIMLFFNGTANLMEKNYQEAIYALEAGKKLSTGNNQLLEIFLGQLGDAYNGTKQYEKSDKSYEEALKINPNNDHVLNNYAYFLSLRKEKLDIAKKYSGKLVSLHPDNPTFLDTHGWVLFTMGEYSEAKKFLEKAVKLEGADNGTIIEHYGDVLFKLGDIEGAVKQWERAKGLDDSSEMINKKIADRKLYE